MQGMNVAVLMGGVSSEREVSLRSGRAVSGALRQAGDTVTEIDLRSEDIDPLKGLEMDAVFPAMHGRFGEDGTLQGLLEEAQIPYVGSDSHASRAAMDKMASKCHFIAHDVPTPPFRLVTAAQHWAEVEPLVADVTLPLVVKPLRQGSSIGVSICSTYDDVAVGLATAFLYGEQALLERYIHGREFTVGILEDRALPIIELRPKRQFFDYYAKYEDQGTEYIEDPQDVPEKVKQEIQRIGLEAHQALGCDALSRVDVMLEDDGCPYVLEVNTIPGFTERSLYPKAARKAGIAFPDLCHHLCHLAVQTPRFRPVVA